jgi:hypothetical protein
MKSIHFLSISMLFILISACSKEGETGPQGLTGEIGPAGENGSVMHSGSGAPDLDLGAEGDYYLDKDARSLYGPKTVGSGWGIPIDLSGPAGDDGDDGADGSQIYAGTTDPDATFGEDGDFYLNKTTYDLFGPKASGSWGSPINLKGTANIIYSVWIDANWNITDNATTKRMKIPVNQLTNNNLRDKSIVLLYLRQYGTSSIYPMPSAGRWSNTFYSYTFGNNLTDFTQAILVELVSTNGAGLTEYQATAFRGNRFRYVIIPFNSVIEAETGKTGVPGNIDFSNYNEVREVYGIRD